MSIHARHKALAVLTFFLPLVTCGGVIGEEPPADQLGESIEFAIAGIIDLDDDGMSDVGVLRSLIADHRGKVTAYCASDGTVVGKFTESISYLILGTPPELQSEARTVFVQFVDLAKKVGVEIVSLSEIEFRSNSSTNLGLFKKTPAPLVLKFRMGTDPPWHIVSPANSVLIPNPFIRRYPSSRWNGW